MKKPKYRCADTSHTALGDPIPAVVTVADVMGRARRILRFAEGPRLGEHGESVADFDRDYDGFCARIVRHAPALVEAKAGSGRALVAAYLLGIAEGHFQAHRFIVSWKEATTAEQLAAEDAEVGRKVAGGGYKSRPKPRVSDDRLVSLLRKTLPLHPRTGEQVASGRSWTAVTNGIAGKTGDVAPKAGGSASKPITGRQIRARLEEHPIRRMFGK